MSPLPGLDGLRALAALAVVFFHYGGDGWARLQGWLGVQLFFTLSGFLITTLLLREGRISLTAFYRRRAFRILPVYAVVLGATTVVLLLQHAYVSSTMARGMPYYLLLCNELAGLNTPFGVTWSIGIEEKFYLLWPLVLLAAAGSVRRALPVALTATGVLLAFTTTSQNTPHYVSILIGCVLALLLHRPRGFALLRPLTHPVASLGLVLGFLYVQLDGIGRLRFALTGDWRLIAPVYSLACALLLLGAISPNPARRLLDSAPLRYVGRRSYALYLCQALAGMAAGTVLHRAGTPLAVLTALLALGLAAVLYRLVEAPMIRLGKRGVARARTA